MKRFGIMVAAALGLSACAAPAAQQNAFSAGEKASLERQLMGQSQVSGSKLDRLIATAAAHPLGSPKNPVRAQAPEGQRAYLARLRCSDGSAPRFERRGNVGFGVFGNIVDDYSVDCGAAAPGRVSIMMDMYHPGHVEQRPVPGFSIDTGMSAAPVA